MEPNINYATQCLLKSKSPKRKKISEVKLTNEVLDLVSNANLDRSSSRKCRGFDDCDIEEDELITRSSSILPLENIMKAQYLKNKREKGDYSSDKRNVERVRHQSRVERNRKFLCDYLKDKCYYCEKKKARLTFGIDAELEQNPRTRNYMEDYMFVENDENKDFLVYVLCDGHGGTHAAELVHKELPRLVKEHLQSLNEYSENSVKNCILVCFEAVEKMLLNLYQIDENKEKYHDCGTTANLVIICFENDKRVVYSANVGDSRTTLIRKQGALRLSFDHKATNKEEIARVRSEGGRIIRKRFFDSLAVTRSLADFSLKVDEIKGLSAIPTITRTEIDTEDKYLVIASDGIWDVITDLDCSQILEESQEQPVENLAKHLITVAMNKGSRDNISCIVIKLK